MAGSCGFGIFAASLCIFFFLFDSDFWGLLFALKLDLLACHIQPPFLLSPQNKLLPYQTAINRLPSSNSAFLGSLHPDDTSSTITFQGLRGKHHVLWE